MDALIRRWNGEPFVAPSVQERAIDSHAEALAWAASLIAGEFDMVLFTTGIGLAYLRDAVLTKYTADELSTALRNVTVAVRGPKPLTILHELGLQPQVRIPEPNTWREMVPIMANRPERRISIQEYGRPNHEFTAALEALGAVVNTIAIYRWELPDDIGPLKEAARRLSRGDVDVLVFTTSVQYLHLMEIASNLGFSDKVFQAMRTHTVVASVGPIMTAALREHGIEPDIEPEYPKMAALVRAAAEQSHAALLRKRQPRS
ncbi:MAG: uroporphyrinogen-III synthase [Bryobacteraceae bacterium]